MSLKALAKFHRLPFSDKILLLESWVLLHLVAAGLRLLPFRFVMRLLRLLAGAVPRRAGHAGEHSARRVARLVEIASRRGLGTQNCLTRALATRALLEARGLASELKIGVSRNHDGVFQAHAWLETNGRVILGDLGDLSRYTVLPSIDAKLPGGLR